MSSIPAVISVSLAGALAGAALAAHAQPARQASQQASLATPWVQVQTSRVRLIATPAPTSASKSYLAGIEITLGDGWKTYWRMPGEAGVPPVFNWSGSTNVSAAEVLYPAPIRLVEPVAETVGYKRAVVFPVTVTPRDPGKPVDLKLELEFGICRDICVPATATFSLALPVAAVPGSAQPDLAAAVEQVPRTAAARRSTDPELKGVAARLDDAAPRLTLTARFAGQGKGADAFVEAPDGIFVPLPKRLPDAADGSARFEIDLSRGGNAHELKGKTLTITLVSDAGASESTWKLD
jgi:DsbC/DsbD-like thiol-disulfide interchange protein